MQNYLFSILTLFVCIGVILYFRKRDKRNIQFDNLKNFIQTSMTNMNRLFEDKEKELKDKTISLDISLKKLDKATEFINKKLAGIKQYSDEIEDTRKNLSSSIKEAQMFDEELKGVKERIGGLEDKLEELSAANAAIQSIRKESDAIRGEIEQTRVWAQENVGDFVKNVENDLGKFRSEFSDEQAKRIEELEKQFGNRIEDAEFQLGKIEETFKDVTARMNDFEANNSGKIDDLEARLEERIESVDKEFREKFIATADALKKEFESKLTGYGSEVASASKLLEDRIKSENKRFDEKVNENMRTFNDKMVTIAKTINDLNGKLSSFVKENSEKFKGEIRVLKSDYLTQANQLLNDLDQREKSLNIIAKELQSQMTGIDVQVKNAAKKSIEDAIEAIHKKELEVFKNMDSSSGMISDRLSQIERAINSFEKDLQNKIGAMGTTLERNIADYKRNVDDLKSLSLKVEGDIEGNVSKRMRDIDSYIAKLKEEFVEDYNQLIDNTKDDIIGLRDELTTLKEKINTQKQGILDDVKESVESMKIWSSKEISTYKDQMDTVKLRADAVLVDIREDLEQKLKQFDTEISVKMQTIAKEGEQALINKRNELRGVASELTNEFENRERELIKRLDGMDDRVVKNTEIIDEKFRAAYEKLQSEAVRKTDETRANLTRSIEAVKEGAMKDAQALDKRMEEMKEYIDQQISTGERLKRELEIFEDKIEKFRDGAEEDIGSVKSRYQELAEKLNAFEKGIASMRTGLDSAIREQTDSLSSHLETEKIVIQTKLKDIRDESVEYLNEIKRNIVSEMERYSDEVMTAKVDENFSEMERFYAKQKESFELEIERFKQSFLPPADELLNLTNKKISELQKGFDEKVKTISEYVSGSEAEFREIKTHFEKLSVTLDNLERNAVERMKETARDLETGFTGKVDKVSRDFDNYIKQSESDFQGALDNLKRDAHALVEELKHIREKTREDAIDEIKNLTRKTRDIETRYDQLIKKGSQLERAEGLSVKSERTMEQLQKHFKELEDRRTEIEEILRQLAAVRDEKKDVVVIINEINENKNDIKTLRANIIEALEKAREAERVVDAVQKQSDKVESVKDTMLKALDMFGEIEKRLDELERKKELINGILASIDESTTGIDDLRNKTTEVDSKLSQIAKISKRLEEEIRAARGNIDGIFEKQDKMSEAVERIVDIDNLFYHIDEEYKKIERMQDWVGKAQNQLERLKDSQTKLGATEPKSSSGKGSKEPDEEVIKSILRLRQQGWSIEEISNNLRMSPTYVELIIDRYELE